MEFIIRVLLGVFAGLIAVLVCKGLNCEPFTIGLWGGTFAGIGSDISCIILNDHSTKYEKNINHIQH